MADDQDTAETPEGEAPPAVVAPSRSRLTLKQGVYVALAVALSIFGGGALPQGHSYRVAGHAPSVADPSLKTNWQPVGAYVMERSLKPAMTLQERLQYEAEQKKLLNPIEEPAQTLNVRIPLLPGPVQRADAKPVIPPTIESTATQLAPPPAVVEQAKVAPIQAPAEKADPLAENMQTLKALKEALQELKAERNAEMSDYRNDQLNQ